MTKSNGNIYLSGGMQFADNQGASWREICSIFLVKHNYVSLNITAMDKEYAVRFGQVSPGFEDNTPENLLKKKSNIRNHFIDADTKLIIESSDALIVYYDESVRRGAGTLSECQIAYNNQKPIFLVNSFNSISEIPGWLQAQTTKIFNSFEELFDYIKQLPPLILKDYTDNFLCFLCGTPYKFRPFQYSIKKRILCCESCEKIVHNAEFNYYSRFTFFSQYYNLRS